jgi:N-glycosylase/DNA lyase
LNYAIIDKHIWNVAKEFELINCRKLNKKNYFLLEKKLKKLAEKLNISAGELDLFLWFMKTGKILK